MTAALALVPNGAPDPEAWLSQPLPRLRDDITLLPGPAEADGAPTWTVYDPVRHRYFRFTNKCRLPLILLAGSQPA